MEFRYGESHEGAPTLTEWYVNEARGLEHGFTLAEAPAGAGPVTLQLAVAGGLQPVLEPDGLAVELRAPDGAPRLRYADLFVTDASGRTLPSTLSVPSDAPARIHVSVDARDAVYPVTIDPMLTTPSTTLTGEAADDYFGYSVATAGDVNGDGYADVVVGAYAYSGYTGRAYVLSGGREWPGNDGRDDADGRGDRQLLRLLGGDGGGCERGRLRRRRGRRDDATAVTPGRAYVYLGGASGLATTAATTLTGETTSNSSASRWRRREM